MVDAPRRWMEWPWAPVAVEAPRVVESVLQPTDAASLVQRLDKMAKGRADALGRAREAKARAELDECTFAPRQKKCPGYIRSIAESHRARNAQRQQKENKGQRPGWR